MNKEETRSDVQLTEHLAEMRKRIIYCLVFFFLAMIAGFVFSGQVVNHLKNDPAAKHLEWHVFGIADALSVYVKVSLVLGLIISLPFFLYQIWAFVKPGLKKSEQKIALRFIPGATLLFVLGIGFGYYILFPMVTRFMLIMTQTLQAEEMFGITQYFSFMFSIVLPFGLLFELPVLVIFLTRLRILNPIRLAKMRKLAYFVLVLVAVTITPPEIISDFLVTIPLLLLYEFSIWLSKGIYKKQLEEDEKWLGDMEEKTS
ncbi:twin-arginine translocase subunit TatC [Ammoniphilus sp. CFH 90114]|uniref:twin-arginine translocase subunit TatC n=1 Tax=Ammoniphilus sp. CFH 90114 TaxID=2493665 RepID=UPI00100F0DFF|nr:twin-arginine translocase subunit TatC [Ammoniphilus sp. CFH 90114]RXT05837.1 twin-arginine translocase subunit TatC [Ammoniphilus sp. CFH 90114]